MANQFGFPTWTLWGMGLSAFGALVAVALAFLAQSPRLLARLNLTGQRLDLRAKAFTGYGLALLLLAIGFFLAGVPLESAAGTAEATGVASPATSAAGAPGDLAAATVITATVPSGSQTGAMVGLPTPSGGAMTGLVTPRPTLDAAAVITGTAEIALPPGATTGEPAATPPASATATPAQTATRAPTATATPTPSPTPTATPILVPTATVNNNTSTLPVRRLPGGPVLVVLVRGDVVIPLSGHAFHTGDLWREISTVNGVVGWVPDQFLDYGPSGDE